jgi:hypothetical protein
VSEDCKHEEWITTKRGSKRCKDCGLLWVMWEGAYKGIFAPEWKCTCDEMDENDLHPCPWQSEIEGDDSNHCSCCPYCTEQCWQNV